MSGALFSETLTYLDETYFQCREHYDMSLTMSSGHIKHQWIPPVHATEASYCSQCVMKALGRIGADRIDPPGAVLGPEGGA